MEGEQMSQGKSKNKQKYSEWAIKGEQCPRDFAATALELKTGRR